MKRLTAEDIIGEWSGSFSYTKPDGETRDEPVYMFLKRTDFVGTIGPKPDGHYPIMENTIHEGKVEGDKITFEVLAKLLFKVELALVDGHLKGEATADHEGESVIMAVDLQRKTD